MPVIADLDAIHAKIVQARQDARGPKNDRAIQELSNAMSDLEKIVRLIVRGAFQGDEAAAKQLSEE